MAPLAFTKKIVALSTSAIVSNNAHSPRKCDHSPDCTGSPQLNIYAFGLNTWWIMNKHVTSVRSMNIIRKCMVQWLASKTQSARFNNTDNPPHHFVNSSIHYSRSRILPSRALKLMREKRRPSINTDNWDWDWIKRASKSSSRKTDFEELHRGWSDIMSG